MRTLITLIILAGLALVPLAPARSQAPPETSVPTAAIGAISGTPVQFRFPLSKFVATPGPLMLRDAAISTKISVPISGRIKAKTVTLTLNYTNSIALKPETSVMSVRFNETTLAQIRLDPKSSVGVARINLPVELVRPGYNVITLALTQHIDDPCEDPEAPELWTEINTADSTLEIVGEVTPTPLHLADVDQIFSPGIGGARRVAFVTPPLTKDAAMIEAGGLVAQAIALRAQYEPVEILPAVLDGAATGSEPWALDDQVIIGTRDQIGGLLADGEAEKINGPYLGLRSLDRRQARLVVSGRTAQDVIVAARALSYLNVPITDAVSASIHGIKPVAGATAGQTLQADRIYGFEELGLPTTTVTGLGTQKLTLTLPMPPDLYAPEQATVDLLLDLNYGAGTGPGSVMNVEVNGKFIHAIGLTEENGSAFRSYRLSVPLRDFVGGPNQVGFNVIMHSQHKDRCSGVSGRHLAVTLFGTSSVQLPQAAHIAAQPDLDLMVRTGFPYTQNTATPSTVWVSDSSLISTGWMFVGRLAQSAGTVLPHLQFAVGGEPPRGSAILIGETRTLPPRVFANAVQALGEVNRVPYSSFNRPNGLPVPGIFAKIWPLASTPRTPDSAMPTGVVEQVNDLGNNLVLTAVRADGDSTGTVTVVTAATRERLIAGMQQLATPQYWGQARGDFMLWQNTPASVVTLRLSPRFQTAAEPPMMNLRFYVSQHPWWWLGGTILVLMLLSGLTVWLLSRRRPPSE